MKNILNKKLNKKGFTLAELLIVVAIIAILVAIAMPLFFGALEKAEEATKNANIRAVRAVAVNEVLGNWNEYAKAGGKDATFWAVNAEIDVNGNVTNVKITPHTMTTITEATATKNKDDDSWTVNLELTEVDVK